MHKTRNLLSRLSLKASDGEKAGNSIKFPLFRFVAKTTNNVTFACEIYLLFRRTKKHEDKSLVYQEFFFSARLGSIEKNMIKQDLKYRLRFTRSLKMDQKSQNSRNLVSKERHRVAIQPDFKVVFFSFRPVTLPCQVTLASYKIC